MRVSKFGNAISQFQMQERRDVSVSHKCSRSRDLALYLYNSWKELHLEHLKIYLIYLLLLVRNWESLPGYIFVWLLVCSSSYHLKNGLAGSNQSFIVDLHHSGRDCTTQ